ncbi:hypothetical protein LGL55_15515 [Clostridium tagluense]|uniref:hypothetical protein n=1 Tax=Clostridium tagluense TaxID=360422 RepID=UPI001CF19631|nr:hypothetical protein [Clostridium tagluense]MCB2312656.1 hypothetical protein [Clostridium tagluense]MCB2317422.1 hypothetical protein [Clostridium tagluense]MCB2322229.1 hypothetical protein [Clostridium tagluense]MCB2327235.1 hypothetical protein [Clostridium tagluense]MCB2331923.1 hypothetical protein [Clostridium tagluense]
MKKSKKGSSLVLVLIVFAILSILGMAMISLAASNYKVKIVKGNIKANMYASESGIDEAYGIIGKMVDEAISKGNDDVKLYMSNLHLDEQVVNKEIFLNKILEKRKIEDAKTALEPNLDKDVIDELEKQIDDISKFIINPLNNSVYVNDDLSINIDLIKKEQNDLFKDSYKSFVIKKIALINTVEDSGNNLILAFNKKYILRMPQNQKAIVYVENFDNVMSFDSENRFTVNLKSIYKNKNIEKIIKADYDIYTPDYEDAFYVQNNHKEIFKNIVWSKSICADGDMKIENNGELNVNGDIYVKGESKTDSNGGIEILNPNVNVTGDISTNGDLSVFSKESNVAVSGNVYARNVIVKEGSDGSTLTINKFNNLYGNVCTVDDLELNSEKSKIDIKGSFYGMEEGSDNITPDTSSSIIINSDDLGEIDTDGKLIGSSLSIGEESIIMGTAYINTLPMYQTGESLSIKGNYRAYTEPLNNINESARNPSLKEGNIIFEQYEPLILASKFKNGKPLLVQDKSDYFKYYVEQKNNNNELNGLNFGKSDGLNMKSNRSIHTGATIINEISNSGTKKINVYTGNVTNDAKFLDKLKNKKNEYNKNVYFMGIYPSEEELTSLDIKLNDVKRPIRDVGTQVNFGSDNVSSINRISALHEKDVSEVIVIKKEPKNYVLSFNNSNPSNETDINIPSQNAKGIIVVNGNLSIYGAMNFTGTIIVNGNISILDDNKKVINYDENYLKKLIASNYNIFNNLFKEDENTPSPKANVQIDVSLGNASNVNTRIKSQKLIKLKNWSLVK